MITSVSLTAKGYMRRHLSLEPFLEKVNAQRHPSVQLSPQLVIFANMPFKRTIKDSVARVQTLQLYKDEIESTFAGI